MTRSALPTVAATIIGAAVATARLLGLSADQTLAALGTGATQSAGMKVVYGSMGKSLHAGKAAMDGLLSGFVARDGFTSAAEPIEGHRGFLHLFSPDPVAERLLASTLRLSASSYARETT